MANRKRNPEEESANTARLNLVLDQDTYDYIKNVGALRKGSMNAYIKYLVSQDREAWKANEKKLEELLKK